jgi:hypothetical protein
VQGILIIGLNCTRPKYIVQKYHAGKAPGKLALFFQIPYLILPLNSERRTRNDIIGFVWVCFLLPKDVEKHQNFHKSLILSSLCYFAHFNIGFVFSNWVQLGAIVSDFRPKAGNWLCFFMLLREAICHNIL